MYSSGTTLPHFLLTEERKYHQATGEFTRLMTDLTTAIRILSHYVNRAGILNVLGSAGAVNTYGEDQTKLDVFANNVLLRSMEWTGHTAGIISEELETPHTIPPAYPEGKYLLAIDPLDGSTNIDVNVSVGTIFSIFRAPEPEQTPAVNDFLQPGVRQVAAGYALYGSSTMLVYTTGHGVHAFTLEPQVGEFFLANRDLKIPEESQEYAINSSNRLNWEPAIQRYIADCEEGREGPLGKRYNMRWIGSMVADFHRILMRGGIFLYPRDRHELETGGKLRLLYEANPLAFLAEQAGGACTDGRRRMLEIQPESLHQCAPVVLGSRAEVDRVAAYYEQTDSSVEG